MQHTPLASCVRLFPLFSWQLDPDRPAPTLTDTNKMSNALTEQEVANALRISTKTLQRWRASGTGPAYLRVAGRVRYPVEGLVEYLAQHIEMPEAA